MAESAVSDDLKKKVRLLALIISIGFGVVASAMILILVTLKEYSTSEHWKLTLYAVFSVFVVGSGVMLFISTFNKSMWCTLPIFGMLLLIMILFLYTLLTDGFCVDKCGGEGQPTFSKHVGNDGGAAVIFSCFITLSLLFYAFIPITAFFWVTRALRKERKKAAVEASESHYKHSETKTIHGDSTQIQSTSELESNA